MKSPQRPLFKMSHTDACVRGVRDESGAVIGENANQSKWVKGRLLFNSKLTWDFPEVKHLRWFQSIGDRRSREYKPLPIRQCSFVRWMRRCPPVEENEIVSMGKRLGCDWIRTAVHALRTSTAKAVPWSPEQILLEVDASRAQKCWSIFGCKWGNRAMHSSRVNTRWKPRIKFHAKPDPVKPNPLMTPCSKEYGMAKSAGGNAIAWIPLVKVTAFCRMINPILLLRSSGS